MVCGSKGIASPIVPTDFEAGDGIALDGCNPVVISTTGRSFLTDEAGEKLTDELGVPLEGIDTIDANLLVDSDIKVQELIFSENINIDTDVVFCTGTLTANLPDPTLRSRQVTIRSISGTTTVTADAGSVETSTLTTGQSTTLVSRLTGWFQV